MTRRRPTALRPSRPLRSEPDAPARPRRAPVIFMLAVGGFYLWWCFHVRGALVTASEQFPMMGTVVTITVVARRAADVNALIEGARAEIDRIERLCSDHKPDSFVSRLNDRSGGAPLHVTREEWDIFEILEEARIVSEISAGAFDVTFASVGRFWDFDPAHPRLPTQEEIAGAIDKIDYRRVVTDRLTSTVLLAGEGTRIGLGGIAKGYAVDKAVAYLRTNGAYGALVNAGGDMYALGHRSTSEGSEEGRWRIAIQHPRDKTRFMPGVRLEIEDAAVVTSGDYERSFVVDGKRYHHIINPRTGMPATGLISVTVVARTASFADGLATAFFVMGAEKGLKLAERLPGVEAIFVTNAEEIITSSGIPKEVAEVDLKSSPE